MNQPALPSAPFELSILRDPFASENIVLVRACWVRGRVTEGVHIYGEVGFRNGATEGKQEFQAATYEELLLKIKAFVESLPKAPVEAVQEGNPA